MTAIDGRTRFMGLIGDPVVQAKTPAMANQRLEERGKLGSYVLVPMHVAEPDLEVCLSGLRRLSNFCGAVVTMPHKIQAASLMDELSPAAAAVGAVNVIRRQTDGRLLGSVLDGAGMVQGLLKRGRSVKGKHVVLVGAGGAACAIAFAVVEHGCASLRVFNRTSSKSLELAQRIRERFPQADVSTVWSPEDAVDIAINATSLGMKVGDPLPMDHELMARASLVADCVIAPEMTRLLETARDLGKEVQTGVPMLAEQIHLMLDFMGVE